MFSFSQLRNTLRDFRIPTRSQFLRFPLVLTTRERFAFAGSVLTIIAGFVVLGLGWYRNATAAQPAIGGTLIEGVLGEPRFINPLFAPTNEVDADLVRLLYAGLFRIDDHGALVPDLAETSAISADGKSLTVTLRKNLRWHDGAEITADDAVFTIHLIQDANVGSPLRGSFRGITVERVDEQTIRFTTERPLAVFLSALTVGVLPEHLWSDIPPSHLPLAELNIRPIGSGPYRFIGFTKDRRGTLRSYTLEQYPGYHANPAHIERLTMRFFTDRDELLHAFNTREIDSIGTLLTIAPGMITRNDAQSYPVTLPQTTAIFLNQKRNAALKDVTVRRALSLAIDRAVLIRAMFNGQGTPIGGPIIPGFEDRAAPATPDDVARDAAATALDGAKWERVDTETYAARRTKAELLALEITKQKAGKKRSELAATTEERATIDARVHAELTGSCAGCAPQPYFRLRTGEPLAIALTVPDAPEFVAAADSIRDAWRAIGVRVTIDAVPLDRLRSDIIPTRGYDALLFSQILGADPDPFPFWHSSQIRAPGLNLSYFSDKQIDTLLEDARGLLDRDARAAKYATFQTRLAAERPAIFLATPTLAYVVTNAIHGVRLDRLAQPSDRFATITEWYTTTKRIWKE